MLIKFYYFSGMIFDGPKKIPALSLTSGNDMNIVNEMPDTIIRI